MPACYLQSPTAGLVPEWRNCAMTTGISYRGSNRPFSCTLCSLDSQMPCCGCPLTLAELRAPVPNYLYDVTYKDLDCQPRCFEAFRGKTLLIVSVRVRKDMADVFRRMQDIYAANLSCINIVALPSCLEDTRVTNGEIKLQACKAKATFEIMSAQMITGKKRTHFACFLEKAFCVPPCVGDKFLFSPEGQPIKRYAGPVDFTVIGRDIAAVASCRRCCPGPSGCRWIPPPSGPAETPDV